MRRFPTCYASITIAECFTLDFTTKTVHGVANITVNAIHKQFRVERYYVHMSERSNESQQKGWVRLREGQSHWLQPQDPDLGKLRVLFLRLSRSFGVKVDIC